MESLAKILPKLPSSFSLFRSLSLSRSGSCECFVSDVINLKFYWNSRKVCDESFTYRKLSKLSFGNLWSRSDKIRIQSKFELLIFIRNIFMESEKNFHENSNCASLKFLNEFPFKNFPDRRPRGKSLPCRRGNENKSMWCERCWESYRPRRSMFTIISREILHNRFPARNFFGFLEQIFSLEKLEHNRYREKSSQLQSRWGWKKF